jgi:hypothetical protein
MADFPWAVVILLTTCLFGVAFIITYILILAAKE